MRASAGQPGSNTWGWPARGGPGEQRTDTGRATYAGTRPGWLSLLRPRTPTTDPRGEEDSQGTGVAGADGDGSRRIVPRSASSSKWRSWQVLEPADSSWPRVGAPRAGSSPPQHIVSRRHSRHLTALHLSAAPPKVASRVDRLHDPWSPGARKVTTLPQAGPFEHAGWPSVPMPRPGQATGAARSRPSVLFHWFSRPNCSASVSLLPTRAPNCRRGNEVRRQMRLAAVGLVSVLCVTAVRRLACRSASDPDSSGRRRRSLM